MGLLDFLRRKKTETKHEELPKVVINDEKVNAILEEEIKILLQEKSQENILNTHLYFSLKISSKS